MQVHLETARFVCDHCGTVSNGIILSSEFAEKINDSIQLCNEHAIYFANEILKRCEE